MRSVAWLIKYTLINETMDYVNQLPGYLTHFVPRICIFTWLFLINERPFSFQRTYMRLRWKTEIRKNKMERKKTDEKEERE